MRNWGFFLKFRYNEKGELLIFPFLLLFIQTLKPNLLFELKKKEVYL
jgi:hypothetical protein